MAPTRGLDLAASSTNAFISSGMEIFMVAMRTASSLRSWRSWQACQHGSSQPGRAHSRRGHSDANAEDVCKSV